MCMNEAHENAQPANDILIPSVASGRMSAKCKAVALWQRTAVHRSLAAHQCDSMLQVVIGMHTRLGRRRSLPSGHSKVVRLHAL